MLKHLRKLYPSLVLLQDTVSFPSNYIWYKTEKDIVFGILQNEITERDDTIISAFAKRYTYHLPQKTKPEQLWQKRIDGLSDEEPINPFRFVYFSVPSGQLSPEEFKRAMNELFLVEVAILWQTESSGIIVEELVQPEQQMNYEQIIDILMADLSVTIHFFIGDIRTHYDRLHVYYRNIIERSKLLFSYSNQKVVTYIEAIPFLLIHEIDSNAKKQLVHSILQEFIDDDDMFETLDMLLRHNLNVSETAKKMYMHRNSLQYRIDKFVTETGINIQQFDGAVAVKLALLAKKILN